MIVKGSFLDKENASNALIRGLEPLGDLGNDQRIIN